MAARLLCWMKFSNAHGRVGYDPLWLPEGDKPEGEDAYKYERATWLDQPEVEPNTVTAVLDASKA